MTFSLIAGVGTPVLGFAAYSGTGKTTLLCRLIPLLCQAGLRLGLLKHTHHLFEIDRPGKDSYLLRQAGARQVLIASRRRTVAQRTYRDETPPGVSDYLRQLDRPELDLLLVEGYKHAPIAKIELHRPVLGYPLLARDDRAVIAIATDAPLYQPPSVPLLDLNDVEMIADFVLRRYRFLKTDLVP